MADLKQEKQVLIRQPTLPLFSVPWPNPLKIIAHYFASLFLDQLCNEW